MLTKFFKNLQKGCWFGKIKWERRWKWKKRTVCERYGKYFPKLNAKKLWFRLFRVYQCVLYTQPREICFALFPTLRSFMKYLPKFPIFLFICLTCTTLLSCWQLLPPNSMIETWSTDPLKKIEPCLSAFSSRRPEPLSSRKLGESALDSALDSELGNYQCDEDWEPMKEGGIEETKGSRSGVNGPATPGPEGWLQGRWRPDCVWPSRSHIDAGWSWNFRPFTSFHPVRKMHILSINLATLRPHRRAEPDSQKPAISLSFRSAIFPFVQLMSAWMRPRLAPPPERYYQSISSRTPSPRTYITSRLTESG